MTNQMTTPKPYEELEVDELNKLAAEVFENAFIDDPAWNPCQDAEQIQRYLFPKLEKLGCQFKSHRKVNYSFGILHVKYLIYRVHEDGYEELLYRGLFSESYEERDKLNRFILISCLRAMDVIRSESDE